MKIEFTRNKDHQFSPRQCKAYKAGKTYTVPREFGEECVADGSGKEIKPKTRSKAKKKADTAPQDAYTATEAANGDRP